MIEDVKNCLNCNEGELVRKSREEYSEYKGVQFSVDLGFSECEVCGSEFVFPEDKKKNKIKIKDAHRKIDGLLTSGQIRRFREKNNLNPQQAANIFGCGGVNSFYKYESGEVIQSGSMDKLIRLAAISYPVIVIDELYKMSSDDELRKRSRSTISKKYHTKTVENATIFISVASGTTWGNIKDTNVQTSHIDMTNDYLASFSNALALPIIRSNDEYG